MRILILSVGLLVVGPLWASELDIDLSAYPNLELKLAAPTEIAESYNQLTERQTCDRVTVPEGEQYVPRGAVELLILCKAFVESGLKPVFQFESSPNYARSVLMVENGVVHLASETIWSEDIDLRNVWASEPVIRDYELEKGLYAPETSRVFESGTETLDFSQYTGVTIRNWHTDWKAIQQITPKTRSVYHFSSIFQQLKIGRADFTIFEFPGSTDLRIVADGLVLLPIPNVKVQLPGTRHFIVSRKFRNSHEVHALLNSGIESLRRKGEIHEILESYGLYNKAAKNWRVLNAPKPLVDAKS